MEIRELKPFIPSWLPGALPLALGVTLAGVVVGVGYASGEPGLVIALREPTKALHPRFIVENLRCGGRINWPAGLAKRLARNSTNFSSEALT